MRLLACDLVCPKSDSKVTARSNGLGISKRSSIPNQLANTNYGKNIFQVSPNLIPLHKDIFIRNQTLSFKGTSTESEVYEIIKSTAIGKFIINNFDL